MISILELGAAGPARSPFLCHTVLDHGCLLIGRNDEEMMEEIASACWRWLSINS